MYRPSDNNYAPVKVGDLATYKTLSNGILKVRVIEVPAGDPHDEVCYMKSGGEVKVKVTGNATLAYPRGFTMWVGTFHMTKRTAKERI